MTINRLPSGGEVEAGPAHGAGSRAPPASSRIPAALIYTLPSGSTRVSETAQVTGPRTPAHRLRRTTLHRSDHGRKDSVAALGHAPGEHVPWEHAFACVVYARGPAHPALAALWPAALAKKAAARRLTSSGATFSLRVATPHW